MSGADALLKSVGAAAATAAAVFGVLPALVGALRGRNPVPYQREDLRTRSYSSPPPWSQGLERYLAHSTESDRAVRRRLNIVLLVASGVLIWTATGWYEVETYRHDLSVWWQVAGAAGVLLPGPLLYFAVVLVKNRNRGTIAATVEGWVQVEGDLDEVVRHCQVVLLEMGARLVSAGEAQVVAATGTPLGPLWLGNRVEVNVSTPQDGQIRVQIQSTKLDYATTSRSRKDVARFVAAWVFTAADRPRASTRRHDRPD